MASFFPSLLSWSELAPFIIRLALGATFIFFAYRNLRKPYMSIRDKSVAIVEGLAGLLLILGLWTQLAALAIVIDLVIRLADRIKNRSFLTDGVNYYLLLLVMAISLMVTGAGLFGFDYKL